MQDDPLFSITVLIARILMASAFLVSGIEKAIHFERARDEFAKDKVPLRPASIVFTIALHLIASLCLIAGWYVTEMAFALAVFTFAATIMVHHFWTMQGHERLIRSRVALANLGLVGGLLLLAVTGPGKLIL